MRAVQITRFGGPEVLDVVDLPDPTPGEGQELYEVSAAGINYADTDHRVSCDLCRGHRSRCRRQVDELSQSRAVEPRRPERDLVRLGPLEVEVGGVLPGHPDTAVQLDGLLGGPHRDV